jgi:ParB family chromosome partitioning protein
MAMGKNKTGIMAAITAAAEASNAPVEDRSRAHRSLPKGTIGSIRAGLGGIQDIDTKLVIPWGPKDRLDPELTAVNNQDEPQSLQELVDSISTNGQQIPVLLRPSSEQDGYFEVIYGRRRILACRKIGISVKALIRTLDDKEALLAKGLENANRAELSFYERARFSQAILEQGYERSVAIQALSISKNTLSQFERITRLVPLSVGDLIGAASNSGRPKWMTLAIAFEKGQLVESKATEVLNNCDQTTSSDDKLEMVLASLTKRGPRERNPAGKTPMPGVVIKSGKNALSVSVKNTGKTKGFSKWLDDHIEDLIKDSFERFQSENRRG